MTEQITGFAFDDGPSAAAMIGTLTAFPGQPGFDLAAPRPTPVSAVQESEILVSTPEILTKIAADHAAIPPIWGMNGNAAADTALVSA